MFSANRMRSTEGAINFSNNVFEANNIKNKIDLPQGDSRKKRPRANITLETIR